MKLTWHCLATGHGDTCDATGDTNRGAEKHAEETGHGTVTSVAGGPFDRGRGGMSESDAAKRLTTYAMIGAALGRRKFCAATHAESCDMGEDCSCPAGDGETA